MFPFECYVISLARTPEKLTGFMERNAATGLDFKHFEAVDGTALEWGECVANGLVRQDARGYRSRSLGSASSHRALWRRAVSARTPVLIFEDDIYCRHDIRVQLERVLGLLPTWDILLLGYNTDAVLEIEVLPSCSFGGFFSMRYPSANDLAEFVRERSEAAVLPLKNAFGLCSYLVSPEGAEKLLANVFPLDNKELTVPYNRYIRDGADRAECRTLDMNVNTLYRHIAAHALVPPLALAPNDKANWKTESAPTGPQQPRPAVASAAGEAKGRSITRRIMGKVRAKIGRIARSG